MEGSGIEWITLLLCNDRTVIARSGHERPATLGYPIVGYRNRGH